MLLKTDSYKITHWNQYPDGVKTIESYFECRKGAQYGTFPFFSLQYILKRHLVGKVVTHAMIDEALPIFKSHFGGNGYFNEAGWRAIVNDYDGHLPISIRAIPEGTLVRPGVALFIVRNTDTRFPWLTNVAETLLVQTWYGTTVGALSYAIKSVVSQYLIATTGDTAGIDFMLQDFGYRGATTHEAAGIGGAAHLLSFLGTDTLAAISTTMDYYGSDGKNIGYSVPATEHSVMTAAGRAGEQDLVGKLLDTYKTGILSVVADSYDIYNFTSHIVGEVYKDQILSRDGTFVIRPDSITPRDPTPESEMVTLCNILWDKIGGVVNDKGYKVIDQHVKLLWGDGIDINGITKILDSMMRAGYAASNIACFGMGGGLLQKVNRDTQRCAIKACALEDKDGIWHDQYKDPLDKTKISLKGRLKTIMAPDGMTTVKIDEPGDDIMQEVYRNGKLLIDHRWSDVRSRVQ